MNFRISNGALALSVALSVISSAQSQANTDLGAVALPSLPGWSQDLLYTGIFLDIDALMAAEGLNRFGAVEVQNTFRDLLDADAAWDPAAAFEVALDRVKNGQTESGWNPVSFTSPADFVAALDLDETLLIQWYASGLEGFFDLNGLVPDYVAKLKSPGYVKFTPGAESFIRQLKGHPDCKGVVVFSAKADGPALDIVSKWTFANGEPALAYLDGVFTRNHLVVGKKITNPSKDLRIFDERLEHVVIVDDNPGRIFQPKTLKAQPKFDADAYFNAQKNGLVVVTTHYENALFQTLGEIYESAASSRASGRPFTASFLPYSYSGERVFRSFVSTLNDRAEALEQTRLHPELQEAVFFPVK